jgi:hypothetical protein
MSFNDRLYDELLKPVVEDFYNAVKALAELPVGDDTQWTRAWLLSRLETLEKVGDRTADVLEVATPEWVQMRDMWVRS